MGLMGEYLARLFGWYEDERVGEGREVGRIEQM